MHDLLNHWHTDWYDACAAERVIGPASGGETTTQTESGPLGCGNNSTTSTEAITTAFFVNPNYYTETYSIKYNGVTPTPFLQHYASGRIYSLGPVGSLGRPNKMFVLQGLTGQPRPILVKEVESIA